ncbi:MAG: lysophospholipid acyltransferase family protein, partial [Myxococcota bacterium]
RALHTLEVGRTLLIFPEGTRSVTGVMQSFKPSLGYLALTAKAPVLPMYLWGTFEAMPKGSTLLPSSRGIGVVMGPLIAPEMLAELTGNMAKSEAYRVATQVIEAAVLALRESGGYTVDALFERLKADLGRRQHETSKMSSVDGAHSKRSRSSGSSKAAKAEGPNGRKPRAAKEEIVDSATLEARQGVLDSKKVRQKKTRKRRVKEMAIHD